MKPVRCPQGNSAFCDFTVEQLMFFPVGYFYLKRNLAIWRGQGWRDELVKRVDALMRVGDALPIVKMSDCGECRPTHVVATNCRGKWKFGKLVGARCSPKKLNGDEALVPLKWSSLTLWSDNEETQDNWILFLRRLMGDTNILRQPTAVEALRFFFGEAADKPEPKQELLGLRLDEDRR